MRKTIKEYTLNENLTEETLKSNGFKYNNEGSVTTAKLPLYFYYKYIEDEIELFVEIGIKEDGTFMFDTFDNVLVLDDDFCQPYHPFYRDDVDTPFVNKVIEKYNEAMDELVSMGILKEKTKEFTIDKSIIFKDYPPLIVDDKTRHDVINNPLAHINCPLTTRLGKFYTNEEYEKRTEKLSKRTLPGDNGGARVRK
ncbi:MAG: hypothetical protein IKX00_02440 [Bacilli bacterium]|nr:hypothetical protein [Bacilli bacterium]